MARNCSVSVDMKVACLLAALLPQCAAHNDKGTAWCSQWLADLTDKKTGDRRLRLLWMSARQRARLPPKTLGTAARKSNLFTVSLRDLALRDHWPASILQPV